jgi:hypothetical membrane protein
MSGALRRRIGGSSTLMLYASVLFVVLTWLAMWLYPGGAVFDKTSDHYLFFGNFFSDLGATATPSGRANTVPMVLLVIALAATALALINFSGAWRAIHARRHKARRAARGSQVFLVLGGLCLLGIAATPWDRLLGLHFVFVKAAFVLLVGYLLCLIRVQDKNHWPRRFVAFNVVMVGLLLVYVALLFLGPTLATPSGLAIQAVAQKVIVYACVINIGLQALGVRGHLSAL